LVVEGGRGDVEWNRMSQLPVVDPVTDWVRCSKFVEVKVSNAQRGKRERERMKSGNRAVIFRSRGGRRIREESEMNQREFSRFIILA